MGNLYSCMGICTPVWEICTPDDILLSFVFKASHCLEDTF